ncbi:MAG TPA: DNA-binding protein [Nitrososphaerales archaeon]|nr:DNA-binding protein [Nitrososphaerales archaeon]
MMDEQHKEAQQRPGSQDDASRRAMRENVIRIALTSEARQRLTNVRMVKPEVAHAIEEYIIQLVSSGRLKRTIDDEQLKELLQTIQGTGKKEFKIRRI